MVLLSSFAINHIANHSVQNVQLYIMSILGDDSDSDTDWDPDMENVFDNSYTYTRFGPANPRLMRQIEESAL